MLRMPFLKQLLLCFLAIHYVMGFISSLDLPKDHQEGTAVPAVVNDLHSKTLNCVTEVFPIRCCVQWNLDFVFLYCGFFFILCMFLPFCQNFCKNNNKHS